MTKGRKNTDAKDKSKKSKISRASNYSTASDNFKPNWRGSGGFIMVLLGAGLLALYFFKPQTGLSSALFKVLFLLFGNSTFTLAFFIILLGLLFLSPEYFLPLKWLAPSYAIFWLSSSAWLSGINNKGGALGNWLFDFLQLQLGFGVTGSHFFLLALNLGLIIFLFPSLLNQCPEILAKAWNWMHITVSGWLNKTRTEASPVAGNVKPAASKPKVKLQSAAPQTPEVSSTKPDTMANSALLQRYTYTLPEPGILLKGLDATKTKKEPKDHSALLEETLASFGVEVKVVDRVRGPAVTRYEMEPGEGVKVSRITSLINDIALVLATPSVRIEAPVPGKPVLGIEIPNEKISSVHIKEILESTSIKHESLFSIGLGKDISGKPIVDDLIKMPHLLIAGATGSGKTICLNSLIASLLFRANPYQLQMLMIDPKRVELSLYEGIPHLVKVKLSTKEGETLQPSNRIITDPKMATLSLKYITKLMDQRYELFVQERVRNITEYNAKHADDNLPCILVIIDELADLMMISSSTVEMHICRLAQLGRAAGIHLIVATQRPSVDVITGLIKANIPSRIAFAVSSQVDSRVILDRIGAEKLLGKGDMLYLPIDASDPRRIQGAFISSEEIEAVVDFWKQQPPPDNVTSVEIDEKDNSKESGKDAVKALSDEYNDELMQEALRIIFEEGEASASNLQRKLKIGYARAGRIIDMFEEQGIVGPKDGSKPRKILRGPGEV